MLAHAKVNVHEKAKRIIARLTSRVFVGLPICEYPGLEDADEQVVKEII